MCGPVYLKLGRGESVVEELLEDDEGTVATAAAGVAAGAATAAKEAAAAARGVVTGVAARTPLKGQSEKTINIYILST